MSASQRESRGHLTPQGDKPPYMPTDVHAQIFRQSLERCSRARAFFDRFHARFQVSSAPLRVRLQTREYERQQDILKASFYYILLISSLEDTPAKKLDEIGKRKAPRRTSINREMYRLWLGGLIEMVKECDPQFDGTVEHAWREMIEFGINHLPAGRKMRRPGH
jgi:hypothetical protein